MSTPEIEVVGQIMMNQAKLQSCDLKPNDFVNTQYKDIYIELLEMAKDRIAIDPISVAERLEAKTGQDWIAICGRAANDAFCHTTFDQQVEKVRRNGQLFHAQNLLSGVLQDIERTKSVEPLERLMKEIMSLTKTKDNHTTTLKKMLPKVVEKLERVSEQESLPGITTGLTELDEKLGGFHDTDLIVIAARPAMGKTALLINHAVAAVQHCPVGFVSAEQACDQLVERTVCVNGSIDSMKMRTAKFNDGEWAQLSASMTRLMNCHDLHIYDETGMSIAKIIKQAREWKFKYDIKALYVDYIQKIKPFNDYLAKHQQVGEIVSALKDLAKELKIPVIALAQVNRDCEKRDDKRPGQGDIADSSEVEKEADEIITIYRDEVYNVDSPDAGTAELRVCKNRHGGTGYVRVAWNGPFMQFKDLETRYY